MSKTIIVCGGRNYHKYSIISDILTTLHEIFEFECVRHGGANGADAMARLWAERCNLEQDCMAAKWGTYGKAAGAIRNKEMALKEPFPMFTLAFPGGPGTQHMVDTSRKHNIPVCLVIANGELFWPEFSPLIWTVPWPGSCISSEDLLKYK